MTNTYTGGALISVPSVALRHVHAQDVSQILRGVGDVDDGAWLVVRSRLFLRRLRHGKHVLENRGVFGQNALVDAELDIARDEDDGPVGVPELLVVLSWQIVPNKAVLARFRPRSLSCDATRHLSKRLAKGYDVAKVEDSRVNFFSRQNISRAPPCTHK